MLFESYNLRYMFLWRNLAIYCYESQNRSHDILYTVGNTHPHIAIYWITLIQALFSTQVDSTHPRIAVYSIR